MTFTSELLAVMVAVCAVTMGSLLGGGTIGFTADFATGVAAVGLATSLCNAFTRELRALRARYGTSILLAVVQMG